MSLRFGPLHWEEGPTVTVPRIQNVFVVYVGDKAFLGRVRWRTGQNCKSVWTQNSKGEFGIYAWVVKDR